MSDDEKMIMYTRESPCVPIYTREYPYLLEKYHVKNPEKQGGLPVRGELSVGNSNDQDGWLSKMFLVLTFYLLVVDFFRCLGFNC